MAHANSRRTGFIAIALIASIITVSAPLSTAQAAVVDGDGGSTQYIGYQIEENLPGDWGDCYGACGPGCSYICSWGGACQTHDFYMRKHGLWSWQQFATFPPALVQWGACELGRGIDWVGQNIVSKVTGAIKWIGQKVAGIFN